MDLEGDSYSELKDFDENQGSGNGSGSCQNDSKGSKGNQNHKSSKNSKGKNVMKQKEYDSSLSSSSKDTILNVDDTVKKAKTQIYETPKNITLNQSKR